MQRLPRVEGNIMGSLRSLKKSKRANQLGGIQTNLCIRSKNQPSAIYLIDKGYLRQIPTREILYSLFGDGYIPKEIHPRFFPKLPFGRPLEEGTRLAQDEDSKEIFLIHYNTKLPRLVTEEAMTRYGFSRNKLELFWGWSKHIRGEPLRPD
jgi:hypothetical protein